MSDWKWKLAIGLGLGVLAITAVGGLACYVYTKYNETLCNKGKQQQQHLQVAEEAESEDEEGRPRAAEIMDEVLVESMEHLTHLYQAVKDVGSKSDKDVSKYLQKRCKLYQQDSPGSPGDHRPGRKGGLSPQPLGRQ